MQLGARAFTEGAALMSGDEGEEPTGECPGSVDYQLLEPRRASRSSL